MTEKQKELPWSDCKVAFPVRFNYISDLWSAFDRASTRKKLPAGWELIETDGAGARDVAIFRIEGRLTVKDGKTVLTLLQHLEEKANKKKGK